MHEVDTLFVISSKRGEYPLDELASSLRAYNHDGSYFLVIVDENGGVESFPTGDDCQILSGDPQDQAHPGFKRARGLEWAIQAGFRFKQVVMLDDSCLVRQGPVGEFCLSLIQKERIGVVGVGNTNNHDVQWQQMIDLFYEWGLPHEAADKPPISLADPFLLLSAPLVESLQEKQLLVPPGADRWTASYGAYLSWVTFFLGYRVMAWGYTHKVLPPLFIAPPGQFVPAPHTLSDRFMIFSSVLAIPGYSESDIREMFKKLRGESAREVASFGPMVFEASPDVA